MEAKSGSATTFVSDEMAGARSRAGRRKRSMREATTVVERSDGQRNEAERDLKILNRNARRLNREARDVLSFQVSV